MANYHLRQYKTITNAALVRLFLLAILNVVCICAYSQQFPEIMTRIVKSDNEILAAIPTIDKFKSVKEHIKISKVSARNIDSVDFIQQPNNRFLVKIYSEDYANSIMNGYNLYVKNDSLYYKIIDFSMKLKDSIDDIVQFNNRDIQYTLAYKSLSPALLRMIIVKSFKKYHPEK